jgi:hypothetical protein
MPRQADPADLDLLKDLAKSISRTSNSLTEVCYLGAIIPSPRVVSFKRLDKITNSSHSVIGYSVYCTWAPTARISDAFSTSTANDGK